MSKIDELGQKIKNFESKSQSDTESKTKTSTVIKKYGLIINISIDLIANMAVGIVIGLLLDKYFGTQKVFLVICLIFSIIAACRTIMSGKNIL